jgi:hypothetical protein
MRVSTRCSLWKELKPHLLSLTQVEQHAADTYACFVENNREKLALFPAPVVAQVRKPIISAQYRHIDAGLRVRHIDAHTKNCLSG